MYLHGRGFVVGSDPVDLGGIGIGQTDQYDFIFENLGIDHAVEHVDKRVGPLFRPRLIHVDHDPVVVIRGNLKMLDAQQRESEKIVEGLDIP